MSSVSVSAVPTSEKILLSRHEAALLLGISWRMLDEIVKRGEIRIRRVGGPIRGRVLFSSVLSYIIIYNYTRLCSTGACSHVPPH